MVEECNKVVDEILFTTEYTRGTTPPNYVPTWKFSENIGNTTAMGYNIQIDNVSTTGGDLALILQEDHGNATHDNYANATFSNGKYVCNA